MTRLDSSIVYNPNRMIFEDRPWNEDYSFKDVSTVLTRLKLVITLLENLINADMFVFYFYYPRFSYCCWIFGQLIVYFFDAEYILSYIVLIAIWVLAAYSEYWEKNISPFVEDLFFRQDLLNKDLMSTNNVMTMDEIMHVKSVNSLLESQEGEEVLAETRDKYNIAKLGYWGQWKESKKGANFSLQWMDVISDFFEKVRNLVFWEDQNMTALFFVLLLVIFIIVTFLPLRFILFIACAYKFACGQRWQRKRIINNREVCRLELLNFLQEQKLNHVVTNFDEKWSRQVRKHMRLPALEEKLTTYF